MKSFVLKVSAAGLLVLGMIGCSSPATTTNTNAAPEATRETKATDTKNSTSATTTVATGDSVGVKECDEYLTKYENCIKDKVPAQARGAFESSMATSRKAWRDAAATPQGKTSLVQACTTMLESTKKSMASYNCTW